MIFFNYKIRYLKFDKICQFNTKNLPKVIMKEKIINDFR